MAIADRKVRVPDLLELKRKGRKITMLTAYDATMAHILDAAGLDVLLVGDSLGMVVLGEDTTLPVTMEMMIHHCRAVANGAARALVIADLPFLTYQTGVADAIRNAGRLIQLGRASAVKLEGGARCSAVVRALVEAGIPVMGHIGLMPQHVHKIGGFRPVGKEDAEAEQLIADAHAIQNAGAFALVVECVPAALAARITRELSIPTIGIGSGPHCDGQVLVSYDAFGLYQGAVPRFVKRYAELGDLMASAARAYIDEVQRGVFPAEQPLAASKETVSAGR
ncbi:MAG TPA: 3-methyl-2-oxobutanoate hydroxymethyltransferase [Bryobacteraceae bacterium]|jgi:3-methyl-2-oxobutanoate hydroxymethyltransferase|nr:3-methyl-2-oxobutanoate hydroxymethyltransferase [Bryobacteraceae bacterium]